MIRRLLPLLLLLPMTALAAQGDPISTTGEMAIGATGAGNAFVTIEEVTTGALSRFALVAYGPPKWKALSTRLKLYAVDATSPELEAKTRAKSESTRKAADAWLQGQAVVEAPSIAGAGTGRYRIGGLGAVVYLEKDQVIARTGDVGLMKTLPLVDNVVKLLPGKRCKGTLGSRLIQVAANEALKVVAVAVEVTCGPESEQKPRSGARVRRLIVKDLTSILQ